MNDKQLKRNVYYIENGIKKAGFPSPEICTTCNGYGQVLMDDRTISYSCHGEQYQTKCTTCNGTGEI